MINAKFYHTYTTETEIILDKDSIVLRCSLEANSHQNIYKVIYDILKPKYFGWNLDSMVDVICDPHCIITDNIYIIHEDFQNLSNNMLFKYLQVLNDIYLFWKQKSQTKAHIYFKANLLELIEKVIYEGNDQQEEANSLNQLLEQKSAELQSILLKYKIKSEIHEVLNQIQEIKDHIYVLSR